MEGRKPYGALRRDHGDPGRGTAPGALLQPGGGADCPGWLTDSEGLISLREKSVVLRLLNDKRAHEKRVQVQVISTILPVAILAIIGGIVVVVRKRKYERV